MIVTSNLTMQFGAKPLFENIGAKFGEGNRYGLIGANGCGKSTLMKILGGDLEPSAGAVAIDGNERVGKLRQDQFAFEDQRVLDVVMMGHEAMWRARQERDWIYADPEASEDDYMRAADLEAEFAEYGGYTAEARAGELLLGLDIPREKHEGPMREVAPGWKLRVLLAQVLFADPDIMLLDEPTNNLDINSIRWLEGILNARSSTMIIISHDRHFLNSVCTHIADIDYETIITYTGGYDDMVLAKTQVRSRLESQNAQREKKIAQLNEFIARFSAGTRSSQVTSRKKEVERLQTTELARSNIQRPYIRFDLLRPSGKHILEFEHLSKSYGEQQVIQDFGAAVMRGEKVCLMGRNGLGKTTLLKSLLVKMEQADPEFTLDGGTVKWGHEAQIGYFPQDHTGSIEKGMTVSDWLHQFDPRVTKEDIRGLLGQMLFSGEEGLKKTEALSGGEAARLIFCRLMLQKPNILILDEPTNHLDLEAINALNVAIQRYEGTVLLVTHDHDLIDEVATRIWHFEHGSIDDFKGPYEEYMNATAAARR